MSLNAGIGETGIAPEADLLIIFTHCWLSDNAF
jgi:hypothetical protein